MMKSSIVSSTLPRSIAIGDFNNDHQMDIVVANSGTNTIGIFLSQDNETFTTQQIYSTGFDSRPYSLAVSDFNKDNYLDIAVANYGANNIGIFLGNQNGTFANQKVFSLNSSRPFFITTGDFNNDNQTDIVVANHGTNTVGVLIGNGNGSFQDQITYSTGYDSLPYGLTVGDFNKDNQLDIAVVNYGTNNIGIFLGYSNGTFANQKTYTTTLNSKPSSITVGDLNNDNHLDILVTNSANGTIGIFLGYENGTFAIQNIFSISSKCRPHYISVGYFDEDNQLDVAVVDSENDQVHILLQYDNRTFATTTTYDGINGSHPLFIAVADFNDDNQSDIVIVNYGTNNILVLSQYFIKPSTRQTNYIIGKDSRPSSVVIYDFNNDDRLDLLVNSFDNDNLLLLTGNDDATFNQATIYSSGNKSAPKGLCIGDFNNDNRMDIVTANYGSDSVGILLAQDNGTFSNVIIYFVGHDSKPWSVAVGDFNNDGRLDVVTANSGSGGLGIFLGHGDGTLDNVTTYSTDIIVEPLSVAVGDVNNDNRLDLVITGYISNNVGVLIGHGDGIFLDTTIYSVGIFSGPAVVCLVDLNNDDYLDIIVSTIDGGFVGILLGYGSGAFQEITIYSTSPTSSLYYVTVTDFNNDHQQDLVVTDTINDEVIIFYGYGNGSFQLARRYSTGYGSKPYAITTAKLNNNIQKNIVVTLWGTGNIGVLTEYAAADFANQKTYLTGSAPQPYSVTTGNFNDDSYVDIAVVNSGSNNLDIFFNSGNGTFLTQITYPTGADSYPRYVIASDVNKDNYLDIVTVNSKDNSVSAFEGHNNGTFDIPKVYLTGEDSYPLALVIGDFNNDNRIDCIIANAGTDSISVLLGFDYTSFQSGQTYSSKNNRRPHNIITSDFNNDKYLDIAVTFSISDRIGILLGYSNGSFGVMMTYWTGNGSLPESLAADDFNNDGRLDIVVVNSGTNDIGILAGYGNGSFSTMIRYSTGNDSGPLAIVLTDINNDGWTDIVVANYASNNIGILLGFGNLTFDNIITYPIESDWHPLFVAAGDFDNDGQIDIVVANYHVSSISLLLGYENGSFTTQVSYSTGYQSWPSSITVGDFNRDNRLDIATSNYNINNVGIFLGYGNGSFAPVRTCSTGDGSAPQFIEARDINNDGILDIAVANYGTSNIVVLFGLGDGDFLLGNTYRTGVGSAPYALTIGDFNHDSQLDIAVVNERSNDISIFLGYGRKLFAGGTSYNLGFGSQPHTVAIGDLNNDGLSDIVVANYGTDNVGILLGLGDGVFDTVTIYSTGVGSAPYSVSVADFNNDNQLDIVVTNSETDNIAILFGYGNGSFVIGETYSTGALSRPCAVAVSDLNNDNILDIVIANSGTNNILLLYGYGNGLFGNETSYALGYGYRPSSVAVKDLNQDSWMDIVIACYGTNHVETLIKMC
ncbi:unnamed protein product [Rotaria sp. Silwood1]|nr:unnamed protein product [Rotaria sp. Silwood1]CAF1002781.1 unnamed protein product [Rotaria sp. Silwood1]CAF3396863.1 unnamed protein product [Rotaria sp. Silwood1]CAF4865381.1 unnamed protein product [Rotaria sp. Silwood1]